MISPKLYSMGTFFNLIFIFTIFLLQGVDSTTFTLTNNCPFKVWPGTLHGARSYPLSQTGFALGTGASTALNAPTGWIGHLWARTRCTTDASGRFSCQTGDCGTGSVSCNGAGGAPPVTLFEFTLQGDGTGKDFYDISLVDGFNVPASISVEGGSDDCRTIGCPIDINARCPAELQLKPGGGAVVGCNSACQAFDSDEYCCRGAYGTPGTCKPSSFSQVFKNACPEVYSYAFDDQTSTFTCTGANYLITFCP